MKNLYFELSMGAAGDMLMAALLDIYDQADEFVHALNNMGLEGVSINTCEGKKCGIRARGVSVLVNGHEEESIDIKMLKDKIINADHLHTKDTNASTKIHSHNHEHTHSDIETIAVTINNLKIPQSVKYNALSVYKIIAEAEAQAHCTTVSKVHFHEVGSKDAIADIVGVCWLIELIGADKITASYINTGSGKVLTAHGVLPVPTPATEIILRGIPSYSNGMNAELCTPTGAALIKHFCSEFGPKPLMTNERTGYGMGKKDLEQANVIRAFLGRTDDTLSSTANEVIAELKCNIDDMSAEAIGYAVQKLFDEGALDVFTTPIYMKKLRPATLLTCIVKKSDADRIAKSMLKYTTSIGVRKAEYERYALNQNNVTLATTFGNVKVKLSDGYDTRKLKAEYDDIAKIASENNMSYVQAEKEIYRQITDNK